MEKSRGILLILAIAAVVIVAALPCPAAEKENKEEIQETRATAAESKEELNEQKPAVSYKYIEYEVIKGDTLYEITESYTGNGFDYWEVAEENRIPNPDLIFPRQKIRIKVKK